MSCMKVRYYRHAKLAAKMNVMMREIIGVVGPIIAVKARRLATRERGGISAINDGYGGRVRGVGGGGDDSIILLGSATMASSSSLEKSKRSSTMKWSPTPMDLLLESKEWCFSLVVNCALQNPVAP